MEVLAVFLAVFMGILYVTFGIGMLCVLAMLIKITWDFIFDR